MSHAAYDGIADFYSDLVAESAPDPTSVLGVAIRALLGVVGPVAGVALCDIACGEGYLARLLAARGASVTGIDISDELLDRARAASVQGEHAPRFLHDDAQRLETLAAESFDLAVCNLALMDIPDLRAVYTAVHRVLRPAGRFAFTITHPCFLSPHQQILTDNDGRFVGRLLTGYSEGFVRPPNSVGIRGKVGTHHRTLSTYLNGLLDAGFMLARLDEPMLPAGEYATIQSQSLSLLPTILLVVAQKQ